MAVLTVAELARLRGVHPSTVRRWLRDGAPVVRRSRGGRARATLLDPITIEAWCSGTPAERELLALRARLPEVLGEAAVTAFQLAPDKRDGAWALCAAWQLSVQSLCGDDAIAIPASIERLRNLCTK